MAGNWLIVTTSASVGSRRMFLFVPDGNVRVSPPIRIRTRELGHVLDCVLVRDCASHATRCAIQRDQDRDGKWLVTVFAPSDKQETQLHMSFIRFRDRVPQVWPSVPRAAVANGTPTSEWEMQKFMWATSSSVGSLDPLFTIWSQN